MLIASSQPTLRRRERNEASRYVFTSHDEKKKANVGQKNFLESFWKGSDPKVKAKFLSKNKTLTTCSCSLRLGNIYISSHTLGIEESLSDNLAPEYEEEEKAEKAEKLGERISA